MSLIYGLPESMDVKKSKRVEKQLILLAHGSPDKNWLATFEKGLETVNSCLHSDACLAYMEMATPSLEAVIKIHHIRGVREFQVLPLFFAAGRHLRRDVPEKITKLQSDYPGAEFQLLDAVGLQDEFWQALGVMIGNDFNEKDEMKSLQVASGDE